ncbi:MAG: helix-turn-helix transcriptional regulator [Chitinophagaceae bacterium]|nr:helix-turn-helix transcriptional regulator [Chitinophagaceae bacterium]MCW5925583.1 helix-turn-helix transcriptional regulator [Chitinophagaceae bacterium]
MNSFLYCFRSYRNWTSREVATQIGLLPDEYEAIESGVENIDDEIAQRLSNLYNAPTALFYTDNLGKENFGYSHNTFSGSNGYVHNLYQQDIRVIEMLTAAKDDEIQLLKEEIKELRQQNSRLLSCLLEK